MSDSRGLGHDDLVTGEAVALDLPAATVALRVASGLIDVAVELVALVLLVLLGLRVTGSQDAALQAVATLLATVLALVVLPTAVETVTRGRSAGKLALGLRTVRDDAGPLSFRQAFLRALVGFVEIWALLGVLPLVSALVTTRGKRLGDLVAGTFVVRERFPMPQPHPVPMPPQLAAWAAGADMAPLPDGLALAVRQLLGRAATLNPGSRAALGEQLLTQTLAHVSPRPPTGEHPEVVLAAVLAERRRRDEARLARDEELRQRLRGGLPQRRR
jgi:uncharacterized RDD family membrane protein YckC